MTAMRMVIEVYGGSVQNVYFAHEAPEHVVHAVAANWDYENCSELEGCIVHAADFDCSSMLACVSRVTLKSWRLLSAPGIQDVLDRAGMAAFGSAE